MYMYEKVQVKPSDEEKHPMLVIVSPGIATVATALAVPISLLTRLGVVAPTTVEAASSSVAAVMARDRVETMLC